MSAVVPRSSPAAPVRRVTRRTPGHAYVVDDLECGHTVWDYDREHVAERPCGECEAVERKRLQRVQNALNRFDVKMRRKRA